MAAPDNTTLLYYFGASGNPTDDISAVGGAINTGTAQNEASANNVIYIPKIAPTLQSYRGIAYRKNTSAGSLNSAALCLRGGGLLQASGGTPQLVSTNTGDTQLVQLTYLSAGVWYQEDVALSGTTTVFGSRSWDANTPWMLICKTGSPVGDVKLTVASTIIGYVFGTLPADGNDISSASSLYDLAIATAKNAAVSATNRKTDPASGIGAFTRAVQFPGGADTSLAIPTGALGAGDYIGYCLRLTLPGGMPKPYGLQLIGDVDLLGDPVP